MASTGIIQRRYQKHELIANPPLIGEVVFALDTEEFGTMINGEIVWKPFEDLIKSVNGLTGHVTITKEDLNLGNIDNTSDLDKPISTAMQNLFDAHISISNPHGITKEIINLGNVDNTSDLDKPISTATQSELDNKLGKLEQANDSQRLGGYLPDHYFTSANAYTKIETDDLLQIKANVTDVYSKGDVDNKLLTKANLDDVYTKIQSDDKFEKIQNKGVADGYASLDLAGKVPSSQLPTSVTNKEILSFPSTLDFPAVGEADVLYIAKDTNSMSFFDVNTNTYEVLNTPLGETNTTAYRGDRGKIAYDHSQVIGNPHGVNASDVGAYSITESDALINTHKSESNPHNITPSLIDAYTKGESEGLILTHKSEVNPHNITPTLLDVYTKGEVDGLISGGNITVDYIRSEQIQQQIGEAPAGTSFNGTVQDALDKLFYSYNYPAFDSFQIAGIPAEREYDTVQPAGDYTVTWSTSNNQNIIPNSIDIQYNNTYLVEGISNSGSALIQIPELSSNIVKQDNFIISALDTRNTRFFKYQYLNWIVPVNAKSIVNDDTAVTNEDTSININVLANDTDSDSAVSIVQSVTQPVNGSVVIESDGTLTYTPNSNFNGIDTFTYTNTEGTVGSVTVTINAVDDPTIVIDDTFEMFENENKILDVITNDVDVDTKSAVQSITQPTNGSAVLNADGTILYTPNTNFNGVDTFTYTNTEGNTGNIVINVKDRTIAVDDTAITDEDTYIDIDVLANDIDADTKAPVQSVTQPTNGTAQIRVDGTVRYTPNLNFNGTDSFTYTNADNSTGTVTVTINAVDDVTIVNNDNFSTQENTAVTFDVTANDTDVDTKSAVQSITQPLNGSAVLNTDKTITYTPNLNFNGTDTFTYTNTEGNTGTVTMTVAAVNDVTVVNNDAFVTDEDTPIDIDVLANDTDVDNKSVVQSVTQPLNGTVGINTDGTLKYTPNLNFNGTDTFTYTNTEGNTGTVTMTVNAIEDKTIAVSDNVTTNEDTYIDIDVTANDTDVDSSVALVQSITQPTNGNVSLNTNGTVRYTPNLNFNGTDNFSYTNTDGNSGTVTINVTPVDDITTVVNDNVTTDKNTPIDIDVISNDIDVDSKALVQSVTQPTNGTAVINTNGTIKYSPTNEFTGSDSFTYTNTEGNTGTVNITVNAVNTPTTVVDDNVTVDQDNSIIINVLSNDTDPDTKAGVQSISQPSHGTAVLNADDTITYTPVNGYYGADSFTYTNTENSVGTVTITVNQVIGPQIYVGVYEYNTLLDTAKVLSSDFNAQQPATTGSAAGVYTIDSSAYDNESSNWTGDNSGLGAYHTIVYPKGWNLLTKFYANGSSLSGGWEMTTPLPELTINGVIYVYQKTIYEQYAPAISWDLREV